MKIVSLAELPEEGVSHNPAIKKQVMLRRGDVPHLTNFSRSTLAPGQTAHMHRHTGMAEVFFVVSGEGEMRIDAATESLRAGTCIAVEAGEAHEISNTGAADLVLIYFGVEE